MGEMTEIKDLFDELDNLNFNNYYNEDSYNNLDSYHKYMEVNSIL